MGFLALFAMAPAAAGQEAAAAPAAAPAGATVVLEFVSEDALPAAIAIADRVTCTVTRPSGAVDEACDAAGDVVEVRVVGDGRRAWRFAYVAPAEAGTYRVLFEHTNTLSLPSTAATAESTFTVFIPEVAVGGGPSGADPLAPADVSAGGLLDASGPAPLVAVVAASVAALLVTFAGILRQGGSP